MGDVKITVGYLDNWSHNETVDDALMLKRRTRCGIKKRLKWISESNELVDTSPFDLGGGMHAVVEDGELYLNLPGDQDESKKDRFKRFRGQFKTFEELNQKAIKKVNQTLKEYAQVDYYAELDNPKFGDRACKYNIKTGDWDDVVSFPLLTSSGNRVCHRFTKEDQDGEVLIEHVAQIKLFLHWPELTVEKECDQPPLPNGWSETVNY